MKRILFSLCIIVLCWSCGPVAQVKKEKTDDNAVVIGYGTIDKDSNNYAVSKLKNNKKSNTSYTNMLDYLEGKIPGVMVSNGQIFIRGIGTNSGETNPMVLIDGVQTDISVLEHLDPNLVDSVEVLKDASASIYGVQGANGVILITLKK